MDQTSTPTLTSTAKPLYKTISMARASKLGSELVKFLRDNDLVIEIAGKNYVPVEGWQFVGMQLGLTEVVLSCDPVAPFENEKEVKYRAVVEVINQNGTVVSRGFAWCSNQESKKKSFEEYAIASMAQTRAIGKSYRNILSWIVKMAGYEATPAEEIDREQMETDLAKAKVKVLKEINAHDITKGNDVMEYIEKVIGKRVIETADEADKIIRSFDDN